MFLQGWDAHRRMKLGENGYFGILVTSRVSVTKFCNCYLKEPQNGVLTGLGWIKQAELWSKCVFLGTIWKIRALTGHFVEPTGCQSFHVHPWAKPGQPSGTLCMLLTKGAFGISLGKKISPRALLGLTFWPCKVTKFTPSHPHGTCLKLLLELLK